ncbi:MAG: asparagine synthase-related protein, partial [Nanoarchaeota archaeon]
MDKLNNLRQKIRSLKRVTVSFSGGVDSTLVSKVAYDELGGQALAVTVKTEFITEDEILYAVNIAKDIGIKHKIVYVSLLDDEIIAKNPADRCYFCKLNILENLPGKIILDGTNADDDPGRPGMQALEELGINSPLKECGITKQEVREIAK